MRRGNEKLHEGDFRKSIFQMRLIYFAFGYILHKTVYDR